jgi:hypothetical protein
MEKYSATKLINKINKELEERSIPFEAIKGSISTSLNMIQLSSFLILFFIYVLLLLVIYTKPLNTFILFAIVDIILIVSESIIANTAYKLGGYTKYKDYIHKVAKNMARDYLINKEYIGDIDRQNYIINNIIMPNIIIPMDSKL